MAVVAEYPFINIFGEEDRKHIRFYSDKGKTLIKVQTGEEYEEAIDLYPSRFTYIEKEDIEEVDNDGREEYSYQTQ